MANRLGPPIYAPADFVNRISDLEQKELSSVKTDPVQSNNSFNNVFSDFSYNLTTATSEQLDEIGKTFLKTYKYGAVNILPDAFDRKSIHVGCKTAPEYSKEAPMKMTRVDNAYHIDSTCHNAAKMAGKKYYSLVRPLPGSEMYNSEAMECHVGNEPPSDKASMYDFITIWSLGPTVKFFGLSKENGDILIYADNIAGLGVHQSESPSEKKNYIYGDANTFVPASYVSMKVSVFDLNQVYIVGGFINGGDVKGKNIPISKFSILNGTNDRHIVACQDGNTIRMVLVQFTIVRSALSVKVLEAKYNNANAVIVEGMAANNSIANVFRNLSGPMVPPSNTPPIVSPSYPPSVVSAGNKLSIPPLPNKPPVNTPPVPMSLNDLWASGTPVSIASNATAQGHGLQGLTIAIYPVALGRGQSGYSATPNAAVDANTAVSSKLNGVPLSRCQIKCDNDPNCLGYSTYGQREQIIETGKEVDPIDVGCFNTSFWGNGFKAHGPYTPESGFPNSKSRCLDKAKSNNDNYFSLAMGWCNTGNDNAISFGKPDTARYGDKNFDCGYYPEGGRGLYHVFKRNFESIKVPITDCDFYSKDITSTKPTPGTNTFMRNKTTSKPNSGELNLTNNIRKYDLGSCTEDTCKFRIELGTDGNITLYRLMISAGTTPTALSKGDVLWDLFSYDPSIKDKLKTIVPIDNIEWKNQANSGVGNILASGENISAGENKYLLSPNGRFKLEIKDGFLQLKTTVYGCFAAGQYMYKENPLTSPTMYSQAVQNAPQPYYVYQTDLSHPKPGTTYYTIDGPNGKAIKPIPSGSPVLLDTPDATYSEVKSANASIPIYAPFNDTVETPISTNINDCMAKCNTTPGCNYIYMQTNNSGNNDAQSVNNCYMGNKSAPAYALNTYNKGPYQLYVKNKVLDSSDVSLNGVGNITSDNFNPVAFGTSTLSGYNFLGENLTSPTEIGPKNTPPGLAIYNQSEYIRLGPSGTLSQPATKTELSPAAKEEQQSTITTRLKTDNVASTTTNTDVFKNELTSFISTSGFRNREGFDTHGYNNPGEQCGVGTNTPCQAGVLFGQLKPLQQIAQDYSSRLGAIERQYQDLSNNIDAYNRRYATLTETDANGKLRNPQYDFSGNQPIVIQDNSKLESKMQNDTKLLALQTNNMYIAGTILTSTLLISAIYLGRS